VFNLNEDLNGEFMATRFQPVDPHLLPTQGWQRKSSLEHAAKDACAPVLLTELAAIIQFTPIAVLRQKSGAVRLVSLQGLHDGENLLVNPKGRWKTGYVPSVYRAYPFVMRKVDMGEKRAVMLCFDHDSGLFRENPNLSKKEERFFDDAGKPQSLLNEIATFMKSRANNQRATELAVAALEKAGLLEPWTWKFENPDPDRPLLRGLFRINEAALNGVDAETLKTLQKSGALTVAYAQLFSLPRVKLLRRLYNQKHPPALPESIDELFGGADDELKIDWDLLAQGAAAEES
jgi:hypothetical protein